MVRFEDHLNIYSDVLEEEHIKIDVNQSDLLERIKKTIDDGEYVVIYLNWKNIKGSAFYNQTDMFHEAIIYGYDDENETFNMIAFLVEGKVYGTTKIPFKETINEFKRLYKEDLRKNQWFVHYGFPIAKIKIKEPPPLHFDDRKLYFAFERGNLQAPLYQDEGYTMGNNIYQAFSSYFLKQAERFSILSNNFQLWNIIILKMVQYNKLMLERVLYLEKIKETSFGHCKKIKNYYEKIAKELQTIRRLSLKCQRTKNPDDLKLISEHFNKIYEYEKRTYPLFKEYLVHLRLTIS
ncbi:hypothetical protein [Cytobacillus oceanisediminis]|uniref:hypothetical protein n=1 Tax=Cytobacillus oceanisediminis TaxID=665099 RepID=UPI001C2333BC|nr:hypothetical protein [Cytobacillus oceanisediminis]MBU8772109.1 hypothetical protein [Cytobacillus oceanisediminis]